MTTVAIIFTVQFFWWDQEEVVKSDLLEVKLDHLAAEFTEIKEGQAELRAELKEGYTELIADFKKGHAELLKEITQMVDETIRNNN